MVICLVRDNHGLFGFWIVRWIQIFSGCNCWLLECVVKAGDCWWTSQWLQCTHTGTHLLLSLSANNTVYLLTHDIALSFSQLHRVLVNT